MCDEDVVGAVLAVEGADTGRGNIGTTSLSGLDEQDGRYHGSQCQLMRQRLLVLKETPLLDSS